VLVAVDPPSTLPPGLLDELVGHWRLDDGAGSMTAHDASARGNDGTLRNLDTSTAWVAGRAAGALDVAARGWVQVSPSDTIDQITDAVTVAAWVSLEGTIMLDPGQTNVGWATALSREKGASVDQHYHLSLNIDARPSLFVMPADDGITLIAPQPIARGTWVHMAGVYDGFEARLFVDGALVERGQVAGPFGRDTTPVIIGGNGNDASQVPTELFPGKLDEIMLYKRALSDDEVRQLAAGVVFPTGVPRDAATSD
jgi:hypothetical protein